MKKPITYARQSLRRTSTVPSPPIACTWKTFFARSNPTVTISCFICQLLDVDLQRPHHGHSYAGVGAVHAITSQPLLQFEPSRDGMPALTRIECSSNPFRVASGDPLARKFFTYSHGG